MDFRKSIAVFLVILLVLSCMDKDLKKGSIVDIIIENGNMKIEYSRGKEIEYILQIEIFESGSSRIAVISANDLIIENNILIVPIKKIWENKTKKSQFFNNMVSNKQYTFEITFTSKKKQFVEVFIGNPIEEKRINIFMVDTRDPIKLLILSEITKG